MEASKCIKERRTVRDFLEKEVPDELLREIVEVASFVPSWKNTQTCRYVVVKNKELLTEIAEKGTFGFDWNKRIIKRASALVVVVQKNGVCGYEQDGSFSTPKGDRWQMFDAGIAAQTFCLAAWDRGIATAILGIFDDEMIARILDLHHFNNVAALIAIGYPYEYPDAPTKKDVDILLKIIE